MVGDRELIRRLFPVKRGTIPIGSDVSKRQQDELSRRIIAWATAPHFDDLSQPCSDALNSISGLDDSPHRRRERVEPNHTIPGSSR